MKRIVAILLCAVLLLTGCGVKKKPYQPTGNGLMVDDITLPTGPAVTEQQMSLAYYPSRSLDPYRCSDYTNRVLFGLVYQGLFAVDASYQAWPVLCERYRISQDMRTYTFYLAKATFSDGSDVTASDVAASLRHAMKSDVYQGRFGNVERVEVETDGAVVVQLKVPYGELPMLLDVPIVKKSQVGAARPIGTGPYIYEDGDKETWLRRRTDWWCAADLQVTSQRIDLVRVENTAQLRDAFEFDDLGLACADPGSESYVDFHSDYELWDCENNIFLYLACNKKSPVLKNQEIRAALSFAIDRDRIVENYYRGFAYSAVLPASPQSPYYSTSLANKLGFDPERLTKAVTAAALESNEIVLLVNTDDGIRLRAARAIASMLEGCGLKVKMSELDGEKYRQALADGNFDLYLGQTKLSANMDLSAFFATEGTLNFGNMGNKATYTLCLEALANRGNYYTLHQKVLEDGMLCPILFRSYAIFVQRGMFTDLHPARDNVFFYTLGRTLADAQLKG